MAHQLWAIGAVENARVGQTLSGLGDFFQRFLCVASSTCIGFRALEDFFMDIVSQLHKILQAAAF